MLRSLLANYGKRKPRVSAGVGMHRDLKKQVREATTRTGIAKLDFIDLLRLIDDHYDQMEATITSRSTVKS